LLGFRDPWVYYTQFNPDHCPIDESEREILKDLADEISKMPLLSWKKEPGLPLKEVIPEHIPYRQRLKTIFEEEIAAMEIGKTLTRITALAGEEKVTAIIDSLEKTGNPAQGVLYLGSSALDAAALDWVRKAGGLAVSFNGDEAAVQSAEVAVMSGTSIILAIISDTFFHQGKEGVLELVKNWDLHKIQAGTLKIHPPLMNALFSPEFESFPQLELVASSNDKIYG
jgi:energy-converting hydrogenase A subunit R